MKGKIAVTPRSLSRRGHPALEELRHAGYEVFFPTPGKQPSEEEVAAFLPACVGYLAGVESIPARVLNQCPDLKVISRNGVGVDNIDADAARSLGIAVELAVGANSQGVAELAITLMMAGLRHVPRSNGQLKRGVWERHIGIEIKECTLGVVGCGQIGKKVAKMALGLGMRVRAYDLYPDPSFAPGGDFKYEALDALLAEADVISLHCPFKGQPVIDAAALAGMKTGAYLVNTARAALVDEAALLKALETGRLQGFATDVYASEPPQVTPLLGHESVITTPHAGGFTRESVARATKAAVDNLLKHL